MRPEEFTRLKKLLSGISTEQELAEIDHLIELAKGKLSLSERDLGFWEGKMPCWQMFRCPEPIRNECPSLRNRSAPCSETEGTYCKVCSEQEGGDSIQICQYCRVYTKWGLPEVNAIKCDGDRCSKAGQPRPRRLGQNT